MSSPYVSQSTSGYNATPPADDGSQVASNQVKWSTIKTKLADVLKTFGENINSAVSTAFGLVPGGATMSSTATNYQVLSSDQGKLIRATASSITITTPDATSVGSPFVFRVLNNSSGTITVDGSGSQTIDGADNVVLAAGAGITLDTDGTNWYSNGTQGTLVGKQLQAGDLINGTISESNGSNAVTFALKTLAGTDPTSADPVLICFRNATVGTGNYVFRQVTSALSLTITSGSTLGATSGVPFRVWLVLFDDGGTIRLGAINTRSGTVIAPIGRGLTIASSTAEGGAGAADSAFTFYTGTAVTSKAYVPLGYCSYESGLATAGSWNVSPTHIQLYGPGVPLPCEEIQVASSFDGAMASGSTQLPWDDTIPQNTEGDQYMTQAITPTSACNVLDIKHEGQYTSQANSTSQVALFQDSTANALAATAVPCTAAFPVTNSLIHRMVAATTSATTFKIRAGHNTGATNFTFNGNNGARKYGGVSSSYLIIREIQT